MSQPPNHNPENDNKSPGSKQYLRYADLAFRMGIIILIGAFAGKKADQWFAFERPYLTILFSLAAIFASLYLVVKDLSKKS